MNGLKLRDLFEFSAATVEQADAAKRAAPDAVAGAPTLTGFVAETAADELNKALDTDVFELLCDGWLKIRQVIDCADPARHPADEACVVPLRDVEITSSHTPVLHTSVGGVKLPDLRFTLELVARFAAVDLVIRDARIRALRPGDCSALVKLKYGGAKLAERATPKWQLPGEVRLGDGVPIPRAG